MLASGVGDDGAFDRLAIEGDGFHTLLGAIFISLMMYIEAKSKIYAKKAFINLRTSEKYCIFAPK